MTNSQHYGPYQVRDLSESWDKDTERVEAFPTLTSGLPEARKCPTVPTAESHPLASTALESQLTLHDSVPKSHKDTDSSHVCHTTWIGAGFSPVRGSTPSTVTCGVGCRPAYLTPASRRLNTVAA